MNNLIPIFQSAFGDETVNAVDAKTLHAGLQVKTEFRHWFRRRVDEYGFAQNVDYTAVIFDRSEMTDIFQNPSVNFVTTLDMAKELAMVERTEIGRKVRKYLIECEKRYVAICKTATAVPDPAPPSLDRMRTVRDGNGELWYCGQDCRDVAGVDWPVDSRYLFNNVPDEWKAERLFPTPKGPELMIGVNGAGLCHLLSRVERPKAAGALEWIANAALGGVPRAALAAPARELLVGQDDPVPRLEAELAALKARMAEVLDDASKCVPSNQFSGDGWDSSILGDEGIYPANSTSLKMTPTYLEIEHGICLRKGELRKELIAAGFCIKDGYALWPTHYAVINRYMAVAHVPIKTWSVKVTERGRAELARRIKNNEPPISSEW
jgi:phage anti-repressor protein